MPFLCMDFTTMTGPRLLDTGAHSDVKILLDDGSEYELHKAVLAAHSDFFRRLFFYEKKVEYKIPAVASEDFNILLTWMYKGMPKFLRTGDPYNAYFENRGTTNKSASSAADVAMKETLMWGSTKHLRKYLGIRFLSEGFLLQD